MASTKPESPPKPTPPHGAHEIREDIFFSPRKSRPSVPVPKAERPYTPTQKILKPEPPHGALGEIREVIPTKRSYLRVPVSKAQRPYKPTQKK
jgi:hypothetical protein